MGTIVYDWAVSGNVVPHVSFILPARNEERFIGASIASIRQHCAPDLLVEIIVVDHHSTDTTRDIARAAGAIVLEPDVATIAALRNEGAAAALGNVFVFLDADVTLTDAWQRESRGVLQRVLQAPMALSGSNCDAPASGNWFLRYWFAEMSRDRDAPSLGSAHMIVPRDLFERLRGFDARLQTGEDPDLCARARKLGAPVTPEPSLRVIHHGYPVSAGSFIRRERWHGGGDTVSLERAVKSKVVWMSVAFIVLHLIVLGGSIVSGRLAMAGIILLLAHLYLSVRVRFRTMHGPTILKGMAMFYLYYVGRSLSFVSSQERGAR
ncbi:MAG: glycosyl transferase, family 2 [Gemmatimonadetes bacterium]|nr:glycosyl transferase, family 2 [Gemmatimonadota bacterium]